MALLFFAVFIYFTVKFVREYAMENCKCCKRKTAAKSEEEKVAAPAEQEDSKSSAPGDDDGDGLKPAATNQILPDAVDKKHDHLDHELSDDEQDTKSKSSKHSHDGGLFLSFSSFLLSLFFPPILCTRSPL
jgi:hypothetical protein